MLKKSLDFLRSKHLFLWSYLNFGINAAFILGFQKLFIQLKGFESYGLFSYSYAIASFFILIAELSFTQSAAKWIHQKRFQERELLEMKNAYFFSGLFLYCLISIILNKFNFGIFLFLSSTILSSQWLFIAQSKFHTYALSNLIGKLVGILLLLFSSMSADLVFGLSYLIPLFILLICEPQLLILRPDFKRSGLILKEDKELLIGRSLAYFYTSFMVIVWFYLYGSTLSGELTASYRLIQQSQALIVPLISILIVKHSQDKITRVKEAFIEPFFLLLIGAYVLFGMTFNVAGAFISDIFIGKSEVFRRFGSIGVLLPLVLTISSVVTNVFLIGRGKKTEWFKLIFFSFVISIPLQWVISKLGFYPELIALGMVVVELLVLVGGFKILRIY